MLKKYTIIFISVLCTCAYAPELDQVRKNLDQTGRRVLLLSYPRSGNTWLRYCLEFLTQRPSLSRKGLYYAMQQPLGWSAGFALDLTKIPIEKVHCQHEIVGAIADTDILIFLVRNPKETFARQGIAGLSRRMSIFVGKGYYLDVYFDNFSIYEHWNSKSRLLIYYEDLLLHPRETLEIILQFLDESNDRLDLFMGGYEKHQATAQALYIDSRSTVNDTLYHANKIAFDERCAIDAWIDDHYSIWWNKYLKHRYAQAKLQD